MDDKAREARRLYMKQWYAKNKDKAKATMERYWAKKAKEGENK